MTASGALPVDDLSILDDDPMIRRVPSDQWVPVQGGTPGQYRPSSMAFGESSDGSGMSVNLGKVLAEHGLPETFIPAAQLPKRKNDGFVRFPVTLVRSRNCASVRQPLPDNPAHAGVFGIKDSTKKALYRDAKIITVGAPKHPPR